MCPEEIQDLLEDLKASNLSSECLEGFALNGNSSINDGGASPGNAISMGVLMLQYVILLCHLLLFFCYHRILSKIGVVLRACNKSEKILDVVTVLTVASRASSPSESPPPGYRMRNSREDHTRQEDGETPEARGSLTSESQVRTRTATPLYPRLPLTDSC